MIYRWGNVDRWTYQSVGQIIQAPQQYNTEVSERNFCDLIYPSWAVDSAAAATCPCPVQRWRSAKPPRFLRCKMLRPVGSDQEETRRVFSLIGRGRWQMSNGDARFEKNGWGGKTSGMYWPGISIDLSSQLLFLRWMLLTWEGELIMMSRNDSSTYVRCKLSSCSC